VLALANLVLVLEKEKRMVAPSRPAVERAAPMGQLLVHPVPMIDLNRLR
jgi:hypothetical protein